MNKKQLLVLILGILIIILIFVFTPKYKINFINENNYIRTEQSSSLYKRSDGSVKLRWDIILFFGSMTVLACGIVMFALRGKNGKNNL